MTNLQNSSKAEPIPASLLGVVELVAGRQEIRGRVNVQLVLVSSDAACRPPESELEEVELEVDLCALGCTL